MKVSKHLTSSNLALKILDVYIGPLLMLGLGLFCFIITFTASFPEANSLTEVRGHLSSYYFSQTGRGKGDYTTIVSLGEGSRFWTNVTNKDNAATILKDRGLEVRYYVDPHSTNVPMDGDAIKAYGLWINGNRIQSVEDAISDDKVATHFYLPAVGVFSTVVAIVLFRRNRSKYLSPR